MTDDRKELDLEVLTAYLGEPEKAKGNKYYWQCPECKRTGDDNHKDNAVYNKDKNNFRCYASDDHTQTILKTVFSKYYNEHREVLSAKQKEKNMQLTTRWHKELSKNVQRQNFLLEKRGLTKDTIIDCSIGVTNLFYTIPMFRYNTEDIKEVFGFEYRPLDFNKDGMRHSKKCETTMAQINMYANQPYLVILEGFIDSLIFYQYLKEIGEIHNFHIVTPSNGVGTVCKCVDDIASDLYVYKKVFAYLDNDTAGMEAFENLKLKYNFIQPIVTDCGCKDFNEHYLKCLKNRPKPIKKEVKSEPTQAPTSEVITAESINTPETIFDLVNNNSQPNNIHKFYEIVLNGEDFKNKSPKGWVVTEGKEYDIPDCFDIPKLLQGDYYVIDSLFKFFRLNTKEYNIKHYETPIIKGL